MKKILKFTLLIISIIAGLYLVFINTNNNEGLAKMVFFDIGQGDAILIITPDKTKILIDGGPGNFLISELGRYLPFYDKKIDIMILTHAHDDHVAGLNEVLKRYQVDLILYPGPIDYYSQSYLEWLDIIQDKSLNLQTTKAGDLYQFSGSSLEILYPYVNFIGQKVEDINATSVVSRYCYLDICVMLTGDTISEVEQEIILHENDLSAQILKAAHHGSQYSNSEEWLEAVNPDWVIIQSGEGNSFNHPHLRILKRLARFNMEVFRNDELGEIVIITDGQNYWLE